MKTVCVISGTETDKKIIKALGLNVADEGGDAVKISTLDAHLKVTSPPHFLKNYSGSMVLDLHLDSNELFDVARGVMVLVEVFLLDIECAEMFLNRSLNSPALIQEAAAELLKLGVKSVFIKGEHLHDPLWIHDYWTNGTHSFWLTQRRHLNTKYSETDSIFSTTVTASLALGYSVEDALVIAKMYVHRGIRLAETDFYHGGFPEDQVDIPYLSSRPLQSAPQPFKLAPYLGLYPVVDSFAWVETLLKLGVKTIQLRIKERNKTLIEEMKRSIAVAKKYQALLFINDYWDLALELGAHAVHLGQEDLDNADLEAIRQQGLLLGVSTYCYFEVARAHAISPSYIAIGPIYPTNSKKLEVEAQGIGGLRRWRRTLNYPLVAIGGISIERARDVAATGVSGVALISAITEAEDPLKATKQLISLLSSVGN